MSDKDHRSDKYAVIELLHSHQSQVDKLEGGLSQIELGSHGLRAVVGGRAFREYSALANRIGLNRSGNLRGMVVSAKWRTAFRYVSYTGEVAKNAGYLAALVGGLAESAPQIESVLDSHEAAAVKGLRLTAIAGTVAQRELIGSVSASAHMLFRAIEGWCMIAGLIVPSAAAATSSCTSSLQRLDTQVQTGFRLVTDTDRQAKAFWSVIDWIVTAAGR